MNNQNLEKAKEVLKGKHIFIAYIEEDKKVAELIWDKLNELGAIPWAYTKNDDNIRWRKEIVRTIRNSDVMILVFSKNTDEAANKHIVKEIGLASKSNIEIIPFMLDDIEDIKNEALAYELEGINWVRKTNPIDLQIEQLIVRLVKYFGGKVTPQRQSQKPIPDESSNFKYKWLLVFVLSLVLLGVLGYFIKPYFSKEDRLYVCYDKKTANGANIKYIGCKQYQKSCTTNNKEHFGHYQSKKESVEALGRCVNSIPLMPIKREEINEFIKDYYKATEDTTHIGKVLSFYSDKLELFFKKQNINKSETIDDQVAYNNKIPERHYEINKIDIQNLNSNSASVLVNIDWRKKDKDGIESSGVTIQKIKLIKEGTKLYIKAIDTFKKITIQEKKKDNSKSNIQHIESSMINEEILRASDATELIGKPATLIKFGGYKTPLCKLAISNDGTKLYFNEVDSSCIRMKNSNSINIVCNIRRKSKKRICKTYTEIKEFVLTYNKSKIFDYHEDTLPNQINFDPKHPENFIFFAKDKSSLHILKNLPYAIKGYDFKTIKISNFYKKMSWYHPDPNKKNIETSNLEKQWWNSVKEFKLIILKNLPYAFKGAVFKDKRLNIYFSQFNWYKANKNYTPILSSLSEEDKEWIKEIKSKDPKKYVDFFAKLEKYLAMKEDNDSKIKDSNKNNNSLAKISISNNINNEERKTKVENAIKIIFKNLDKTKYLGSNFDYWPEGGLQSTYDHIKEFIAYKTLNNISPYSIFLNDVHTKENLNLNSKNNFGYYNPKFINWINDRISTVIDDGTFIEHTRDNFNKYLYNLISTYWYTYRVLHNDKKIMNKLKNEYINLIKNKKLPDGFYYNIAWNSEKYKFMQYLMNDKKLDVNIISPAVYFWIRRSIDKTDEKIYLIFDKILRAYDSSLIFYETKGKLDDALE